MVYKSREKSRWAGKCQDVVVDDVSPPAARAKSIDTDAFHAFFEL